MDSKGRLMDGIRIGQRAKIAMRTQWFRSTFGPALASATKALPPASNKVNPRRDS